MGQVRAEERGEEYPKKEVPHNLKLYLKQQEDAIIQEALDKFNGRKEKRPNIWEFLTGLSDIN